MYHPNYQIYNRNFYILDQSYNQSLYIVPEWMKNHHYNYNLLLSLPYTSHQSPNLTKAMKHYQQKISLNTAMYLLDDCP